LDPDLVLRYRLPGSSDVLACTRCPLLRLAVRCRAVFIPSGDETSQDALNGVDMEFVENLKTHAKSFQSPEGK
jgi:hypothetical protein